MKKLELDRIIKSDKPVRLRNCLSMFHPGLWIVNSRMSLGCTIGTGSEFAFLRKEDAVYHREDTSAPWLVHTACASVSESVHEFKLHWKELGPLYFRMVADDDDASPIVYDWGSDHFGDLRAGDKLAPHMHTNQALWVTSGSELEPEFQTRLEHWLGSFMGHLTRTRAGLSELNKGRTFLLAPSQYTPDSGLRVMHTCCQLLMDFRILTGLVFQPHSFVTSLVWAAIRYAENWNAAWVDHEVGDHFSPYENNDPVVREAVVCRLVAIFLGKLVRGISTNHVVHCMQRDGFKVVPASAIRVPSKDHVETYHRFRQSLNAKPTDDAQRELNRNTLYRMALLRDYYETERQEMWIKYLKKEPFKDESHVRRIARLKRSKDTSYDIVLEHVQRKRFEMDQLPVIPLQPTDGPNHKQLVMKEDT